MSRNKNLIQHMKTVPMNAEPIERIGGRAILTVAATPSVARLGQVLSGTAEQTIPGQG
jgi:hypothetical protein